MCKTPTSNYALWSDSKIDMDGTSLIQALCINLEHSWFNWHVMDQKTLKQTCQCFTYLHTCTSTVNIWIATHKAQVKKISLWRGNFKKDSLLIFFFFNTSYLTDSYIVFTIKMESIPKDTIFGLKMIVKSGLEKIVLKCLHAGRWLFLLLNFSFRTLV